MINEFHDKTNIQINSTDLGEQENILADSNLLCLFCERIYDEDLTIEKILADSNLRNYLFWFLLEEKMILKLDIEKYMENWQNDEFYFYLVENNLTLREEITKINDTKNGNIDDIKQEIEARLDEKLKETIKTEYNFIVNYKNDYKLDYSLFFFKMRGHDLEQIYNKIFLQSNSQNIFDLNNKLKIEQSNSINNLKDFFLPDELCHIFRKLTSKNE
jgi:hypothetical protein